MRADHGGAELALGVGFVAEDLCAVVNGEPLGRLGRVGEFVDAGRDVVLACQPALNRDPLSASKRGPDAFLVQHITLPA